MIGTTRYLKAAAVAAIVSLVGCSAVSAQTAEPTPMPTEYQVLATAGNGGAITIAVPTAAPATPANASEAQEAGYHMSAQAAVAPGAPQASPVNAWGQQAEFSHAIN